MLSLCVQGGLAGHAGTVGNKESSDSSVLKCTLGKAKCHGRPVLQAQYLPYLCCSSSPVFLSVCVELSSVLQSRVWLLVIIGCCTCYPSAVDAAFKLLHLQIAKLLSSTSGNLLEGSCFTSTIIMPDPLLSRSLKLPALVRVLECRSKFEKRMGPFTHWDTIWTCVWPLLKTCEDTVLRHSV